jgi:hypothetical protein
VLFQAVANCQPAIQLSFDGTTFLATGYTTGGPYHNAAGGASAYLTQASAVINYLPLAWATDNLVVPYSFEGLLGLVAVTGSQLLTLKATSTSYGSGTVAHRTNSIQAYYSGTPPSTVKALRFLNTANATPYGTNSFIRVKWLGDYAQVPTGNAIAEAPADGGEYVRVNGIWRLKEQTFTPTGSQNITVPAGAKLAHVRATLWQPSSNSASMRWSADGSTFVSGASDYSFGGFIQYAGSASVTQQNIANAAAVPLHATTDNASIPAVIDMMLVVAKPSTTQVYDAQWRSTAYNSAAAQTYAQWQFSVYTNNATLNAVTALKAFQIFPTSIAWTAGSQINVEWIY